MSKVTTLKDKLIDELIRQIDSGEAAPALLSVAAKVVKDLAHEAEQNDEHIAKAEKLSNYLQSRKGIRLVQ